MTFSFLFQQQSSTAFLSNPLPDNWEDMSDPEQLEFIQDNIWQPLENRDPATVREEIYDNAESWEQFISKIKKLV